MTRTSFPSDSPVLGMLGGGQLGRMTAMAARRMGIPVVCWAGGPNGPDGGPAGVANTLLESPFDCPEARAEFLSRASAATVEFENIPGDLLDRIEEEIPLRPGAEIVRICQNREREKRFLSEKGIPCAAFSIIDSAASLAEGLVDLPADEGILKTAEFGYDGKGQLQVRRDADPRDTWADFGAPRAVLEEKVNLACEVSVLVVRGADGEIAAYEPVENLHRNHILDLTLVPAGLPSETLDEASGIARDLAEALGYVGVLAVEFFVSQGGRVLVNELAPRPHNSGHHTLDSCYCSQFEQQVRAVCGLPLGSTERHSEAVMLNLLGDVWNADGTPPDWNLIHRVPGASLHLYEKAEARPGRKMGHATFVGGDRDVLLGRVGEVRQALGLPESDCTLR